MTVITKPISDNKVDKPLEKPLVVSVNDGVGVECVGVGCDRLSVDGGARGGPLPHGGQHDPELELWTWAAGAGGSARRRRVSATTTVGAFVATLLLLTGAIIGGVYIYRQFTHHQMSRFRGWCGVPFKRDSLRLFRQPPIAVMHSSSSHWPDLSSDGIFNEQYEVDIGSESHEKIYVPDFGLGRDGKFIHDFIKDKTAIVDTAGKRCFIFPLDRNLVAEPREMFRIFRDMWRGEGREGRKKGFHGGNMIVIRQTMQVLRPPVEEFSDAGEVIAKTCHNYTTYRLVLLTPIKGGRMKREAEKDTSDRQAPVAEKRAARDHEGGQHTSDHDDDQAEHHESLGHHTEDHFIQGHTATETVQQQQQQQQQQEEEEEEEEEEEQQQEEEEEEKAVAAPTPFEQSRSHFTVAEFTGKAIVVFTVLDE